MSELRQDLVSKDWIISAPERAGRPRDFAKGKIRRTPSPHATCPFEKLKETKNWPPILSYPNEQRWEVVIIPNKYPALVHHQACPEPLRKGPHHFTAGVGHHDLLITRDHRKTLAGLPLSKALRVFLILQERYRVLAADRCLFYSSTFFNWGKSAGASLYHPHYQVLTLPIIPPEVYQSIRGSRKYYEKHRECAHCVMLAFEKKDKKRIVAKNKRGIAVAPFASRQPFEVRVFPQRHLSYFERTPIADLRDVVAVLRDTLKKIRRNLGDPDLNFFVHTSPLKEQKNYRHYHWHIEIIPKTSALAGFELSTGVEINVVDPDAAAAILRKR